MLFRVELDNIKDKTSYRGDCCKDGELLCAV